MDECPSCGGEMEERRRRDISLTMLGVEGGDDEELLIDDGDHDLICWICSDCGYREEAQYRGDEDGDDEEES
jgi:hypothetical protein